MKSVAKERDLQRAIVVLTILLFSGCGRPGDSRSVKESSNLCAPTTAVTGVSNLPAKTDAKPSNGLSDEGEIRVAACEYILRNDLKHLTNGIVFVSLYKRLTNGIAFVSLTNTEMQALGAELPGCRFRSAATATSSEDDLLRDTETGDTGFCLIIGSIQSNGSEATVILGAGFAASTTLFTCHLKRRVEWTAERVEQDGIVDFPRRFPPHK